MLVRKCPRMSDVFVFPQDPTSPSFVSKSAALCSIPERKFSIMFVSTDAKTRLTWILALLLTAVWSCRSSLTFFCVCVSRFLNCRLGKMIIANHRVIRSHTWKVFQLEADTYYYDGLGQVTAKAVSMTQTDP